MPGTVLITGCSEGGIGFALVEAFHAQGLQVYATARSKTKMSHLENLPNVTLLELDVVSPSSIEAAVEIVREETGGKLDILVNNAGQSIVMPALDTSIEDAKKMFDVNFWGVIAITQALAPMVISAKGTIVNVASLSGFLPVPWMSLYNASKAALTSYSETLRLELEPFGVKVITLVTGAVATNIVSHSNINLPANSLYLKALPEIQKRGVGKDVQSKSTPADFANVVVKDILVGGTSAPVWRGAMASIMWFMVKFMPTSILDRAMKAGTGLERLP